MPGYAANARPNSSADPQRDGALDRQRVQAGTFELVLATGEGDGRVRPQRAQHRHLLVQPRAAGLEVAAQRPEFELQPADPHAEPEPSATEHVHLRRLLREDYRVA